MTLKTHIDNDIKKAMLARSKEELLALRSIKSAILLAETEKGASEQLSKDSEMKLLMKAVKQRKESADLYSSEGRQDLADKEMFEHKVISKYLPEQMSDEALRDELATLVTELGATGRRDMGKVMGVATKQLAGKADGKKISTIVQQLLTTS